MPHVRSSNKQIERFAKRTVRSTGYYDKHRRELACLLDANTLMILIQQEFDYVPLSAVQYERGEILEDNRGQGSLQRL